MLLGCRSSSRPPAPAVRSGRRHSSIPTFPQHTRRPIGSNRRSPVPGIGPCVHLIGQGDFAVVRRLFEQRLADLHAVKLAKEGRKNTPLRGWRLLTASHNRPSARSADSTHQPCYLHGDLGIQCTILIKDPWDTMAYRTHDRSGQGVDVIKNVTKLRDHGGICGKIRDMAPYMKTT